MKRYDGCILFFFTPFQCIKFTEFFFEQDMHTDLPTYMISEKIKKCALHLKQKSLQTSLFLAEVLCSPPQWQIHTAESFVLLKERNLSLSLSILINCLVVQLGNLNPSFWVFWIWGVQPIWSPVGWCPVGC